MTAAHPTRRTVLGGLAALTGTAALVGSAGSASASGTPPLTPAGRGWVRSTLARMTLQEKVGQLFVQYVYGPTATTADARNTALYGVATAQEAIAQYHLGGVIYFAWSDNLGGGPQQIAELSNGLQRAALTAGSKAPVPLTLTIDQEQGVVTRIGPPATQFPGSMALGAGRSTDDARTAAAVTGVELAAMGLTTDAAPDADVNVNPLNPVIGVRSFGSDPSLVSTMVAAHVRGYQQDAGLSATAKHFPGHGDTATDSHTGFPVITHTRAQWQSIDAPPFRAAVAAGIDMVMTAHIQFPSLDASGDPATLSRPILTGLLRDEIGFDGVVITDSLEMQGVRDLYGDPEVAVRALLAGADHLLMTPSVDASYEAVLDAVRSGRLPVADLDAKVTRILSLKHRRGVVASPYVDPAAVSRVVGTPAHLATADAVTRRTTTLVRNDGGVLPLAVTGRQVLVTGYGVTTTATLGTALAGHGARTTVLSTGTSPSEATISSAVAAAAGKDAVVVASYKVSGYPAQRTLVDRLRATGVPVVVIAVSDPYDVAYLGDAPTYLAAYSFSPVALTAAAAVVAGEVAPAGRLPVVVPVAGDPSQTLYPFGYGLHY